MTSYEADVDTDADYAPDHEVVSDGYFHESEVFVPLRTSMYRSMESTFWTLHSNLNNSLAIDTAGRHSVLSPRRPFSVRVNIILTEKGRTIHKRKGDKRWRQK